MKKVFILVAALVSVNLAWAQWEPDVRLTNDPGTSWTSYNNAWCIAASGDTIHVVWEDDRTWQFEVYYKRSTDGGLNWGTDTRLTNSLIASYEPTIVLNGSVVHVFWFSDENGNYEIYYKQSSDGGDTWGSDTRLTNIFGYSREVSAAISGSIIHVVWQDDRDGADYEIYYKRSMDGGLTWDPDTCLTSDDEWSAFPCVSGSGSVVHVVWEDYRYSNGEIYYIRSTDGGLTWGEETRLTNDPADSWDPCIAVSDSTVHIVWFDERDGNREIYYIHSTDGGVAWESDMRLTNSFGYSQYPSIAAADSNVHVVWYDNRDMNEEIYYQHSEDAGLSWDAMDTRLTNSYGYSEYPSIAVADSAVHVVWMDLRDGNDEIYYKRNPTGNIPVGIGNDLVDDSGKPFAIYPNPASSIIHIQFNDHPTERSLLIIRNILGETLITSQIHDGKTVIDISALQIGLYFVEIVTPGKQVESVKLVIRR